MGAIIFLITSVVLPVYFWRIWLFINVIVPSIPELAVNWNPSISKPLSSFNGPVVDGP